MNLLEFILFIKFSAFLATDIYFISVQNFASQSFA
jgi:hypothetical protein